MNEYFFFTPQPICSYNSGGNKENNFRFKQNADFQSLSLSSVAQSCPTLWDPMNHSTPGLPVHQNSWSSAKPMSIKLVMPSNNLILCRPLLLPSIFPSTGIFQMNQLFSSGGQSIGISASASVLPMNMQGCFPLGWTGLISLHQSKDWWTLKSLLQHHRLK